MFTGFSVPLDALPSVMTPSPEERAKLLSVKSASGILGITIVAKIATEYFEKYGTDNPKAYFNLTIIWKTRKTLLFKSFKIDPIAIATKT